MLDNETKRRIDSARDMLVGKIPDPKSQVEQITLALIYKFMDDMDAESEELGGKRKFFTGDFARYGWAKLMRSGLGGYETLNLYAEGITKIPENPGIPSLFRDIFKNAFLPYRDPETLKSFLKIIDEFTYDHSERLGDAFEYLLSVLGSQGDAGQFRTPRHIIDFIVAVVDPKKDETVLDPACGTAGFLISSYKHILKANKDKKGNSKLTPDEKGRLAQNFKGYDISPDMVRLSLVNLYLHGFTAPNIDEYDTLTSEDKWNDLADVILANPPFMSPKGGIKPHKRFSVQSKRSEVLFIDYMAEHLTPKGRAGIIVPEGIIFQSQNAYKQLRKMLVEDYLVAVISLPPGVFNPYSGVKTSILIMDKSLAKQSDTIGFFKVENDGFGLGAQRRKIDKDDLPIALNEITEYIDLLRSGEALDDFKPMFGLFATKEKVAENGEYNLSGERYRENEKLNHLFSMFAFKDTTLFRIESGGTPKSKVEEYWNGDISWATLVDLPASDFITQIYSTQRSISKAGLQKSSAKLIPPNSIIVSTRATIGRIGINRIPIATNQGFKNIVIEDLERAIPEYVALAVTKLVPTMDALATGGTFKEISKSKFSELQIPLPPLEVQNEIVAEIEGYQKVIDGARAVVDNYKPHIVINPEWPVMELEKVVKNMHQGINTAGLKIQFVKDGFPIIQTRNITSGTLNFNNIKYMSLDDWSIYQDKYKPRINDVLFSNIGTIGKSIVVTKEEDYLIHWNIFIIRTSDRLASFFLKYYLDYLESSEFFKQFQRGGTVQFVSKKNLSSTTIPLPPIATQQAIIAEIEAEQALVAANQTLIEHFEKKIQTTIARVWGEDESANVEN